MAVQKILLPYNFTNNDVKALEFVARMFVCLEDIEITVFNAYMPVPEVAIKGSPVMDKLSGNLGYLAQKINEQKTALMDVRENLVLKGFSEDQIKLIFKPRKKDIAHEIVDLANNDNFKIVVINRRPETVTRFFTGSIFNKVVKALKDKTICIVS